MELMTIEDVAKFFSVKGRSTIDNWLYDGVLPRGLTVRVGRRVFFIKEKLDEFIEKQYKQQIKSEDTPNVIELRSKVVNL